MSTMVNNFKRVSAFSPFLASSKDLTDVYLKTAKIIHFIFSRTSSWTSCVDIMTRKDNEGQVVIRVHMQRGILIYLSITRDLGTEVPKTRGYPISFPESSFPLTSGRKTRDSGSIHFRRAP